MSGGIAAGSSIFSRALPPWAAHGRVSQRGEQRGHRLPRTDLPGRGVLPQLPNPPDHGAVESSKNPFGVSPFKNGSMNASSRSGWVMTAV